MKLNNRHKEMIVQILNENLRSKCKIILYGSRYKGDAHSASDLDLIIKSIDGQAISKNELKQLHNSFIESHLPFRIDIRDYYSLPNYFLKYIDIANEDFYKNY
ncbi:MAG TPA: nucleotidyltransferase domain-containing protein [Candidatus Kapabacteria bacterium]|nr:nucleotidyltransferase domain-containing protein [Candidatus Kapabacteria bacterium]